MQQPIKFARQCGQMSLKVLLIAPKTCSASLFSRAFNATKLVTDLEMLPSAVNARTSLDVTPSARVCLSA